jgi:hypothetical protein
MFLSQKHVCSYCNHLVINVYNFGRGWVCFDCHAKQSNELKPIVSESKPIVSDMFCPRHGRASRPVEIAGLRCDCGGYRIEIAAEEGNTWTVLEDDIPSRETAEYALNRWRLLLKGELKISGGVS